MVRMSFEVSCPACRLRFTMPADLYERKVKGRVTSIRCVECGAEIAVDGTVRGIPPARQTPRVPARAKAKRKPPTRPKAPPRSPSAVEHPTRESAESPQAPLAQPPHAPAEPQQAAPVRRPKRPPQPWQPSPG